MQVNNHQTPVDINVSVDTSIRPGSYQNRLLFSAIGNPLVSEYSIEFAMDDGVPQLEPIKRTAAAGVTTFALPATVPTKENFQFREWRDASSGKKYNPSDEIKVYSDEEFVGDINLVAEYDPLYTYEIATDCDGGEGCMSHITYGPTTDTSYSYNIPNTTPEKEGYNFIGYAGSDGQMYQPGDTITVEAGTPAILIEAQFVIGQFALSVSPNGGVWSGSTSAQTFTQDFESTKTVTAPSTNAEYTISYDDNGQDATFGLTEAKAERAFTGWKHSGAGSFTPNTSLGGTYTFGAGTGELTAQYADVSNTFVLPSISKLGHSCKWAEGSVTGDKYSGGASRTALEDTTYFASCAPNQYTLTINPNGGKWNGVTTNTTVTQSYGTSYPNNGGLVDAVSGPTYSITYNMGTTGVEAPSAPTAPTSASRSFVGWSASGIGSWDENGKSWTFGAGNGTLTANWSTVSNTFTLPELEKTGHTCKWHQDSATGPAYDGGTEGLSITKNTVYYAVCDVNQYKLTVDPNGGKWNNTTANTIIVQDYDTLYPTSGAMPDPETAKAAELTYNINYEMGDTGIAAPSGTGVVSQIERKFSGWTKSDNGTWDSNSKTYRFGVGDGKLTAEWSDSSNIFSLPELEKTGYTCAWHEGSIDGAEYGGNTSRIVSGDTTYYAKCTINQYKLTVNPNGGTWGGKTESQEFVQNYNTNKTISNPAINATYTISYNANSQGATYTASPTSVNRPFTGWSLAGAGSYSESSYTYGAGNGTLTAQYSAESSSFKLPEISKTGHTCYWASNTGGTKFGDGGESKTISSNTSLFAYCTTNKYSLTIKPNGGKWNNKTTDSTVEGNYNTKYPTSGALADATNGPSYTISYSMGSTGLSPDQSSWTKSIDRPFSGWTSGGTGTWNSNDKNWTYGAGNGTLTANWNNTSNAFSLPAISKTGHSCEWTVGSSKYGSGQTGVTITGDTTFTAVCTANSYNVTVNSGTGIASTTGGGSHTYNTSVDISATAATGYHFTGWTVNSGGVTIKDNKFTMPANAVDITANAALNTCSIKYNANAPSGTTATGSMNDSSMTYGSNTTLTANAFAVTGYQFQGWAESASGAKAFDNSASISGTTYCTNDGSTKDLYAVWAKKYTYTLNLNANDGTTSSQPVSAGPTTATSYTFSNLNNYAPTRDGYKFLGWATTSTGASYVTSYTLNSSSAGTTAAADGFPVSGNIYAIWEKIPDVSISNSNTTSSVSILSIPSGESRTVTVTPSSGYYLSGVSCPNGYTCSGASTGPSYTGTQTVTVKNDDTTSSGTLAFTGTALTLAQTCANASLHGTFTYSGVEYIKLKTNSAGTTSACYTHSAVGSSAWGPTGSETSTISICPAGTGVPTKDEFQALINAYGSDGTLYNTTGWSGGFWSATSYGTVAAYLLAVSSSNAHIDGNYKPSSMPVVCIVR